MKDCLLDGDLLPLRNFGLLPGASEGLEQARQQLGDDLAADGAGDEQEGEEEVTVSSGIFTHNLPLMFPGSSPHVPLMFPSCSSIVPQ